MKKLFTLILGITLAYSCSTSSDDNGNTNTTVLPSAPAELSGTLISNQVALTWTDNSTNESGFKIDRKLGSGNWVVDYASVNADIVNYTDTSVLEGTTYSYRVCSYNAGGKSLNYSNQYTVTITAAMTLPTLSTNAATSITNSTATSGGNITSDGGAAIIAKGVCWSTSSGPTIALSTKTSDGTGIGIFTSNIAGLSANNTYYVRAYATNSSGTSYGNEVSFSTLQNSFVIGPNVTDIEGNVYQSVTNCALTITKQNLNVSKYTDGTPIPQVTDPSQWQNLNTGAWCYYNNDPTNEAVYGKMYNWYAVAGIHDAASLANPALRKKLAPVGWHVPAETEWRILTDCLGGAEFAGGKMKSTGTIQQGTGLWQSPNLEATNISGFTGLPGGYRNIDYFGMRYTGIWWCSNDLIEFGIARLISLDSDSDVASFNTNSRYTGFSVRCAKD